MAYSFYDGNFSGSSNQIFVPFGALTRRHVSVRVGDPPSAVVYTSTLEWVTDSVVVVPGAIITAGTPYRVFRTTPWLEAPRLPDGELDAATINYALLFHTYAMQEIADSIAGDPAVSLPGSLLTQVYAARDQAQAAAVNALGSANASTALAAELTALVSGVTEGISKIVDSGRNTVVTAQRVRHELNTAIGEDPQLGGGVRLLMEMGRPSALVTLAGMEAKVSGSGDDSSIAFSTRKDNVLGERARLEEGLVVGTPSGGDRGLGTVNASKVHSNGVELVANALSTAAAFPSVVASTATVNYTLPRRAVTVIPYVRCITDDAGFVAGETTTLTTNIPFWWTATQITFRLPGSTSVFVYHKGTGVMTQITLARWVVEFAVSA